MILLNTHNTSLDWWDKISGQCTNLACYKAGDLWWMQDNIATPFCLYVYPFTLKNGQGRDHSECKRIIWWWPTSITILSLCTGIIGSETARFDIFDFQKRVWKYLLFFYHYYPTWIFLAYKLKWKMDIHKCVWCENIRVLDCLLMSSADICCKQFGPRSGLIWILTVWHCWYSRKKIILKKNISRQQKL